MSEENKEQNTGITRRAFLKRSAVAATVAALAPFSALEAFAEAGTTPSLIELSQSNHDLVFDYVGIRMADRTNYLSGWFLNKVDEPLYSDFIEFLTSGPGEDLGKGYISYPTDAVGRKANQKVIVKGGKVVFKNAIIGPIIPEFTAIGINPIIRSLPSTKEAPEYGPGMFRLSFPDRGLAIIGPKSADWTQTPVYAVEGFIAIDNPAEYSTSPWLNAGAPVQADNPQ